MPSKLAQLAKRALELIKPSRDLIIKKVVIGVLYTGIELEDETTGVSLTLTDRSTDHEGYHRLLQKGFLSDKTLFELIEYCSSQYAILRSIGVAALNTYCQAHIDLSDASCKDIVEILKPTPGMLVGMVGNIQPISLYLAKKGISVRILDRFMPPININSLTQVNELSDLEVVDNILVSGSALLFDNFDGIIQLLPYVAGKKILIGPSAQIFPKLAFDLGFTAVGSSRIINSNLTLRIIQEGGGYKFFKDYTEKYVFLKE
ncbi:MAG: Rossmann-like domain-containing protein [Candidatus Hodarchaeota archaeon]